MCGHGELWPADRQLCHPSFRQLLPHNYYSTSLQVTLNILFYHCVQLQFCSQLFIQRGGRQIECVQTQFSSHLSKSCYHRYNKSLKRNYTDFDNFSTCSSINAYKLNKILYSVCKTVMNTVTKRANIYALSYNTLLKFSAYACTPVCVNACV